MSEDLVKRLRSMLEGNLQPSPLGRRAADRIEELEARVAAAYAYSAAVTGDTTLLGQVSADAEAHMGGLLNKAYEEGRATMSDDLRNRVIRAIQAVEIPEGGWPEDRPGVWLMALDEAVKAADAAFKAQSLTGRVDLPNEVGSCNH